MQQIALEKLVEKEKQPLKTGKRSNRRREKGEKGREEDGEDAGGARSVCLAEARTP